MEFEPGMEAPEVGRPGAGGNDEFERELRQAFERRPAPPRLKRKVMEEVRARRERKALSRPAFWWWQQAVAGAVLAGLIGGAVLWRRAEERREGEIARRQVMTALRITGHALNEVNARLAVHDKNGD